MSKLATSTPPELRISGLTGIRGYNILFRDLSFTLPAGKFASLSGPNGSGKTTLLRIIAGLIRPETGSIDCPEERLDQGPFYLGHENGLRPNDTAQQHLRDWADLHHAETGRIDDVIARVGLSARALVPAHALSAGQKKRIGLARALLAPRTLWLLDEPAAALDVKGQALLCDLIRDHIEAGGMCLAALHDPLNLTPDATLDLGEFQ